MTPVSRIPYHGRLREPAGDGPVGRLAAEGRSQQERMNLLRCLIRDCFNLFALQAQSEPPPSGLPTNRLLPFCWRRNRTLGIEGNIVAACWLCNQRRHKRKSPLPGACATAHIQGKAASNRGDPAFG